MDNSPGTLTNAGERRISFGRPMRANFLFDDDFVNLNHGSFGAHPRQIQERLRFYQEMAEKRPDQFIRYDYPKLLDHSRGVMAKYLNAPEDEIIFVPNATTGVNTILRNLQLRASDCILYFASIYGACEKTIAYVCENTGASMVKIGCTYPISDEQLCEMFRTSIKDAKANRLAPKIALFDVVSSLPGVRVPFESLVEICRLEGVMSLVDGAHAPGLVKLDLQKLQPDFLVGNCHKWLLAPRACAVLYVPTKHQGWIRSTIPTSHGFVPVPVPGSSGIHNPLPPSTKSEFVNQFEFVGALDNSPYLCVPDCLTFIEKLCGGEERYRDYIVSLAAEGGRRVAEILGTEIMDNPEKTLTRCAFSNVRLPLDLSAVSTSTSTSPIEIAQRITDALVSNYNTFLAVYVHAEAIYVRLSGQIYLEVQDFEWIARVLKRICLKLQRSPCASL